ncbi:MAG: nickel pincer cofactor biosynthesis protein LarC [Candidatus Omnitrophica bacterium]|nr:nickel pincer cofactor biosynthesis protein LarC [Candidatus Omnitrophota bacterium]
MKIAYFDCFSGVSGDMLIGALLDAGLSLNALKKELRKIDVPGYSLSAVKTERRGIAGTKFTVKIKNSHLHHDPSRVKALIKKSGLSEGIKTKAIEIFDDLALSESVVHNRDKKDIFLHEIGDTDAIIDVTGVLIALELFGLEKIYASSLNIGSGFVLCRHGTLPVPAPAAGFLLKNIPVYSSGVAGELVTPTGAAVMKNIACNFGPMPEMVIKNIGYGAGDADLPVPNLLRVYIGEKAAGTRGNTDEIMVIETNIDNTSPEIIAYAFELLFKEGAVDVFMTPIFMKKNRPAYMLSVLCRREIAEKIAGLIFREIPTFGVRMYPADRMKLLKQPREISTSLGRVRVNAGVLNGIVTSVIPEYEDCKKIAETKKIPLKQVFEAVHKSLGEKKSWHD